MVCEYDTHSSLCANLTLLIYSPSRKILSLPSAMWKRGASTLHVVFLSDTRRRESSWAASAVSAEPSTNLRPHLRLLSVAMTGVLKDIGRLPGNGLFFPTPKLASALFNIKPSFVSNCEPNHAFRPLKKESDQLSQGQLQPHHQ